jgi:hypothetical protein
MLANFVQETANAPGTAATINLGGPVAGRVGFAAAYPSGATCFYGLDDGTQGEWGIGTVTHGSPVTLARTTVLGNTTGSTARLNFTGITRVYATLPAERAVWRDASNNVSLPGATLAVAPPGSGQVHLNAGTATNPGYVGFFTADGTRRGYLGWGDGTNSLLLTAENGWSWKVTSSLTVTGLLSAAGGAAVNGAAGSTRALAWQSAGSLRWQATADSTAESGSNAGSNFSFAAHSDAGALIGAVYTIARASRVLDFKQNPTVNGVLAGALSNRQVFAASGTWTKPSGYPADTPVLVECWGGGGGGSTWASWSGGGGGGAYAERLMRLGELGATETVTVGSGGSAGSNGGTGGTSSFGARLSAFGGGGGLPSSGGGGGGIHSAGNGSAGGRPAIIGTSDNHFGGAQGGSNIVDEYGNSTTTDPGWSGYGGGGGSWDNRVGGRSVWGGGGGGGSNQPGGTSSHGGNGGTGGTNNAATPGGGGGRAQPGARGEVRVTVLA